MVQASPETYDNISESAAMEKLQSFSLAEALWGIVSCTQVTITSAVIIGCTLSVNGKRFAPHVSRYLM